MSSREDILARLRANQSGRGGTSRDGLHAADVRAPLAAVPAKSGGGRRACRRASGGRRCERTHPPRLSAGEDHRLQSPRNHLRHGRPPTGSTTRGLLNGTGRGRGCAASSEVLENGMVWLKQRMRHKALFFIPEALVVLLDRDALCEQHARGLRPAGSLTTMPTAASWPDRPRRPTSSRRWSSAPTGRADVTVILE